MTKMTRGCYRPAHTHADWAQALTALPEDTQAWFQSRIGQAISGHPTPDGVIPVCQGSGENGKSALLTDGLLPVLGDYAAPASPKLIGAKNEHSTERADLRGQRVLIAEEMTDERALNITAIKQITDVGTIKARHVHRDNMTFTASHSLFVTTNYIPIVNETDHGTWRRLALVEFPFTFRKPGEARIGDGDRPGDPKLKSRLRAGKQGQHDAVVTWAVEGARAFYASGFPPLPRTVAASTHAWRKQADRILSFWEEVLVPDRSCGIVSTELLVTFNAWMRSNGRYEWSKELFHARFKSHIETGRHRVEERRPRTVDVKFSRPPGTMELLPERPYVYLGVRLRNPGETSACVEETSLRSDRSDESLSYPNVRELEQFIEGSDRPDQACCDPKVLKPLCKLCPRSPTYWQQNAKAAMLLDSAARGNQ